MRNRFMPFPLCLLFFFFLLQPAVVVSGASEGLLLWFHTVLPTLFPFFVITSLLTGTNAISMFSSLFSPVFCRIFRISPPSVIAVMGGFLCGYPMGAKLVSDLWENNDICQEEGLYLLSFCNNASPMFIVSFFVTQNLGMPELAFPSLAILFLSPILCSFLFRKLYLKKEEKAYPPVSSILSQKADTVNVLEIFDHAISSGMETVVKIGGYIIFFSILIKLFQTIPIKHTSQMILLPALEITNGITMLAHASLSFRRKYILMMAITSFGGLCAAFQTKCVISDQTFPFGSYLLEKLVTMIVTSLLSFLYIQFL